MIVIGGGAGPLSYTVETVVWICSGADAGAVVTVIVWVSGAGAEPFCKTVSVLTPPLPVIVMVF